MNKKNIDRNIQALKLFLEGKTKQQIANHLNLSRESIRKIIENLSGESNPTLEALSDKQMEALENIRKELGIKISTIADRMGVGAKYVTNIVYRRNTQRVNPNFKWRYYVALSAVVNKKLEYILNNLELLSDGKLSKA